MFRFTKSTITLFRNKMTSISDLKIKSTQANEIIESLKAQIERIKLESSPDFMQQKAKKLEKENIELKAQVEELKKNLEQVEALKGTSSNYYLK
jgi:predicted nuclease with TOPRIM domain